MYRKNVGVVVFNKTGKVLLCARADQEEMCWQFPQGGMENGEDIEKAARRELFEETGIKKVRLVSRMEKALRYDFPEHFRLPFQGQEQYWVLFYFEGDDKEINLAINPQEIEFKDYMWGDIGLAQKYIVEFKKKVYAEVIKEFAPIIKDFICGGRVVI